MKKIALLLILAIAFVSCNNDDDNTPINVDLIFNFTQNWDGNNVTNGDFDTTVYTNEKGHKLKIARIRYLISRLSLKNSTGDIYNIDGYNFIDMEDSFKFYI